MKRGKRRRSSKAANPPTPEIPVERAAGPSAALSEADRQTHPEDEFIDRVEEAKPGSGPTALAGANYVIDLGDELIAAVEEKKVAGLSAAVARADRRTHPRYEFIAAAEVVPAESGARMETRVRDLSQQGCYVDTSNALPLGTITDVRITKETQLFEAEARVVYSRAGKGTGLVFTAIEPEQLRTLETWLVESRESSWLAANRRRSQRVLMTIPVRVSGQGPHGWPFEEETHTRAVSAHGALILLLTQVYRGQRLTLSNLQTKASLECVVARIEKHQSDQAQVGVEFTLPNPMFWHVAFPPKDWTPRHPDAKSHVKNG